MGFGNGENRVGAARSTAPALTDTVTSAASLPPGGRGADARGQRDPRHRRFSDGDRWVIAAGLVDLASLAPTTRTAPAGARWYERVGTADYMRVLWSERFALPLVIESGTRDGKHVSRTTVQRSTRFAPPWRTAREFRRIDLSDLGD